MAILCCWPPESWFGYWSRFLGQPDPCQQPHSIFLGLFPGSFSDVQRGFDDIFQGGQVGEKVETLENHANISPLSGDVLFRFFDQLAIFFVITDHPAIDKNVSAVDLFEMVNATQQGAFPGPGRADDDHHFVLAHFETQYP